MSGPWEKYQVAPSEGPWTKYAAAVPTDEPVADTSKGLVNNLKMAAKIFLNGSQQDPTNEMAQAGANQTGEDIATSKLGQKFPNIGAGVGTVAAVSPLAASMLIPMGPAREAAQAGEMGNIGKLNIGQFVSGPGRAEAGAAIGSAEKAVGVNPDILPTMKDMGANLGIKNPNTEQYLNALSERLKSGEELGPQALSQHHKMIAKILSRESTGLAKKLGVPSAKSIGEPAVAQAAKINKMLVEQLNAAAPGRELAAQGYREAIRRINFYKTLGGAAATAVGGSPLIKALMKSVTGGD